MSILMRSSVLAIALFGCVGHADLGDEIPQLSGRPMDGGARSVTEAADGDIGQPALSVQLTAAATEPSCGGCFLLIASISGGEPPYTFVWDDATEDLVRHVCPGPAPRVYFATLVDGRGRSMSASLRLASSLVCNDDPGSVGERDPSVAPPVAQLCLTNGAFDGEPAVNLGSGFNAIGWKTCPLTGGGNNTPDLLTSTSTIQGNSSWPPAPDGTTFAGLTENETMSQELCEAVNPGDERSFEIDLYRLPINAGVIPETEQAFVRLWGGTATDCAKRELLWSSPALTEEWRRFCVRMRPQHYTDLITLEASSDQTLGAPIYVLVDRMRPVDACP